MRRVVASVLFVLVSVAGWWALPSAPAAAASGAEVVAKPQQEQLMTVPVNYARWAELTDNYRCDLTAYVRFPELHGWRAAELRYYSGTMQDIRSISAPYDDNRTQPSMGALPAGQHQSVLGGYGGSVHLPPYKECTTDVDAKEAELRALFGTELELRYVRSEACAKVLNAAESYQRSVKRAKHDLRNATSKAARDQARHELKFFKKKLKKAKKKIRKLC
jgi:hypothetical protein